MRSTRPRELFNKITIFTIGSGLLTAIILIRLFHLQVLAHDYYQNIATREQMGYTEIPAQRGEILIRDYHSNEEFPVATNTTLNLLYADPGLIKDPQYIVTTIAPLIFNIEDERAADAERIREAAKKLAPELTQEEADALLKPKSDAELEADFRKNLLAQISAKQRPEILLGTDLDNATIQSIKKLTLPGVEVIEDNVYAYPPQISNRKFVADQLAPLVQIPSKKLETLLKGENRYTVLKRKLHPDISDKIKELQKKDKDEMLHGLDMKEEYFRFYPEKSLAANVIGYVNQANVGQYGIESTFNKQLEGTIGKLQTKKDSIGRQITVGESDLEAAVDGDDIVLTVDRSIQMKVEEVLGKTVQHYQADSGQVVIMNPNTGAIIAMAHYPSFDPNSFGDVFKKMEINLTLEEMKNLYPTKNEGVYDYYTNPVTLNKYPVFEEKDENGTSHYYRYENFFGPEVYHNKAVSWPYEPGSVFKTIAMAIGIDDGDITPNTTFNDSGPIPVDWNVYTQDYDHEIKNSEGRYFGLIDMKIVLAQSLNTGMTFISKKIGPALFYSYLKKFGFMDRTDIEFDTETVGKLEYYEDWTESELATHAFGQGLTVTMIQLVNAYCAIANGGILMQPYIVSEIRHDDGTVTKTEPREVRRVISEDSAAKMSAMLTYSAEEGVAKRGQVPGHFIAAKTGTSQTYKHGIALSGAGTTIGTFMGFAPINDPQFVMLVKIDYAKSSEWGSSTAAPAFSEIAEYIFDYYNIPPDKK